MTVLIIGEAARDSAHRRRVRCRCECGNEFVADAWKVNNRHTKSCGCQKAKLISAARFKHGQSRPHSAEYRAWSLAKNRCLNPNDDRFSDYGGRGISFHQAWVHDFPAFYAYIGARPSAQHSLDRINVNGNYEPGNVRWATRSEQRRNRRTK